MPVPFITLGSQAYRLPGRYPSLFLMPPEYTTYVAPDPKAETYTEYDVSTGLAIRRLLGPDNYGTLSNPSADGTRIAVENSKGVRVVSLVDEQVIFTTPKKPEIIGSVLSPTGDRLAVCIRNPDTHQIEADRDTEGAYIKSVIVHDIGKRRRKQEFHPLVNFRLQVEFSQDGQFLAISGKWMEEYDDQPRPFTEKTMLQIWDLESGEEVFRKPGDFEYTFSLGGKRVLITDYSKQPMELYQYTDGVCLKKYRKMANEPFYVQFSPDGTRVLGIERNHDTVAWDALTAKAEEKIPCPYPSHDDYSFWLRSVGFRADGSVVILHTAGAVAQIWTLPSGKPLSQPSGGTAVVTAARFTNKNREILTAAKDGVLRRWDVKTGKLLEDKPLPEPVAKCCRTVYFGPKELLFAWSVDDGYATFDMSTEETRHLPAFPKRWYETDSLSADGWFVEVSGPRHKDEGSVRIEHILKGGSRDLYQFQGDWAATAFHQGRLLLLYDEKKGSERKLIYLKVTPKQVQTLWSRTMPIGPEYDTPWNGDIDQNRAISGLRESLILLAPDGLTALVTPSLEQFPFVVDLATGETVSTWKKPYGKLQAVHPKQPLVAVSTISDDGLILVDWLTGKQRKVVQKDCYPHHLAWSPDGSYLFASHHDGTASVFDMTSL
ncbi:MAG: WD40 repeat domain-containing protein [Fimbriiglobus sp.]